MNNTFPLKKIFLIILVLFFLCLNSYASVNRRDFFKFINTIEKSKSLEFKAKIVTKNKDSDSSVIDVNILWKKPFQFIKTLSENNRIKVVSVFDNDTLFLYYENLDDNYFISPESKKEKKQIIYSYLPVISFNKNMLLRFYNVLNSDKKNTFVLLKKIKDENLPEKIIIEMENKTKIKTISFPNEEKTFVYNLNIILNPKIKNNLFSKKIKEMSE